MPCKADGILDWETEYKRWHIWKSGKIQIILYLEWQGHTKYRLQFKNKKEYVSVVTYFQPPSNCLSSITHFPLGTCSSSRPCTPGLSDHSGSSSYHFLEVSWDVNWAHHSPLRTESSVGSLAWVTQILTPSQRTRRHWPGSSVSQLFLNFCDYQDPSKTPFGRTSN